MPRGDKSAYTARQKRKAAHIEEGYRERGVSEGEAERRPGRPSTRKAGAARKSGSGRGRTESHASSRKGGRKGGKPSARRPAAARSASAKKAAATRRRRASGTAARKSPARKTATGKRRSRR